MNCVSGIQCVLARAKTLASLGSMPSTRGLMSQPKVVTMTSRGAVAEFLHRRGGAGRIVVDAGAELLEIGPALVPALHRVGRVGIAEDVGQAPAGRSSGAGIQRPRIGEALGVLLYKARNSAAVFGTVLQPLGAVAEERARR